MSNKSDYDAWMGFLMFFLWGIVIVGFLICGIAAICSGDWWTK